MAVKDEETADAESKNQRVIGLSIGLCLYTLSANGRREGASSKSRLQRGCLCCHGDCLCIESTGDEILGFRARFSRFSLASVPFVLFVFFQ